jgi:hypothetical protein
MIGDFAGVETAILVLGCAVLLTLPLCAALRPSLTLSHPVRL